MLETWKIAEFQLEGPSRTYRTLGMLLLGPAWSQLHVKASALALLKFPEIGCCGLLCSVRGASREWSRQWFQVVRNQDRRWYLKCQGLGHLP